MVKPVQFFDSRPLSNAGPKATTQIAKEALGREQEQKRDVRSNRNLEERTKRASKKQMKQQVEALEAVEEEQEEEISARVKEENLKSAVVQEIRAETDLTDEEAEVAAEDYILPEALEFLLIKRAGHKMTFTKLYPHLKAYLEALYDFTITKSRESTNAIVYEMDQLYGPRNQRQQWQGVGWSEEAEEHVGAGVRVASRRPSKREEPLRGYPPKGDYRGLGSEQLADALKANVGALCNGNENAGPQVKEITRVMLGKGLITKAESAAVLEKFRLA